MTPSEQAMFLSGFAMIISTILIPVVAFVGAYTIAYVIAILILPLTALAFIVGVVFSCREASKE